MATTLGGRDGVTVFTELGDVLRELDRTYERAKPLGERDLSNGTRLIGHVPHLAPEAWLHIAFPGLESSELVQLESDIGRKLPRALAALLRHMNGLSLYSDSLYLYGLRTDYRRTGDSAWQPFSILTPNTIDRPRHADSSLLFIGGQRSGVQFCIDDVDRVHEWTGELPLRKRSWPGLYEMLVEEIHRIELLFDDRGRQYEDKQREGADRPST